MKPEMRYQFQQKLLATLAHDLRQPFASIIMMADMLTYTHREPTRDDLEIMMTDLRETASKSIALLDGLLDWDRSQKDGFAYSVQRLLLEDLVNEANALHQPEQLRKELILNNTVENRQVLYGHRQMLLFIIRTLLDNATRFALFSSEITVRCTADKNGVTITVNNNKQESGMQAESYANIIERQEEYAGHGFNNKNTNMAFTICQDMIGLMKGKLWASSINGQGTTFYLKVPGTTEF